MGIFIVFEGGEGSGKSTQARLLYGLLLQEGHSSVLLHEPGGTSAGDQIRRILKSQHGESQKSQRGKRKSSLSPMTELLLFSAARTELVNQTLIPALKKERVVVCDRYTASTIAYQGYGRGLPLDLIQQLNRVTTQGNDPSLVVLLNIDPEKGLSRVQAQGAMLFDEGVGSSPGRMDEEGLRRFEEESVEFHQRVREGYLELAREEPERWLVVDATLPRERVAELIWQRVEPLLKAQ
ncbi:MAG: dTMP kinase [Chloroflexi bacterium]|nr:dTMP kinase [Chloroflexota bacterium]